MGRAHPSVPSGAACSSRTPSVAQTSLTITEDGAEDGESRYREEIKKEIERGKVKKGMSENTKIRTFCGRVHDLRLC